MAKRKSKSNSSSEKVQGGGTLADKGLPIENVSEAADGALGAGGKAGVSYEDSPDKPDPSSVAQIEVVETPVGAEAD
jgi:hypothetical protein